MTTVETGMRARTRRAILDAAVATLSKNPGASLSDVAAAAGVGRTTIHRYFPERSDLITAIGDDLLEKIAVATERARPGEGPALQALDRLCQQYFELGDGLMLVFAEPHLMAGEKWEVETPSDRALLELIERGHAEGVIDAELPADWVQQLVWSVLYTAWQHIRDSGASKHESLGLCLRSLRKSLAT
ncbi:MULTISPECIES: TetR/AcrR family transcriptional regulator [Nonomuraea]|uniref:TetR/AcrR family transcriptional regulator n=1 Tax=Nonomuraea mangrovi TaxID=2316207 RepID=A0ABW4T285_9ACTN